MRIKRLEIYGYGKWVDQHFDVNEKLQIFYGRNEAGKSTLQSFVRSILFGFPSRRRRVNQLNRFEPKHANVYGGRILFTETKHGDLWIERTEAGLNISTQDGEELPNPQQILNEVLGGLNEQLFDNFYAFNLQNLQKLSAIDAQQLSDYFLSIGTVGSDQFLAVAKELEKDTSQIYLPRGQKPILNQLLNEYDQQAQKLAQTKSKMERYNSLVTKQTSEEARIAGLNEELQQTEQALRELDKLQTRYNTYLQDLTLQRELEQLTYVDIPKKTQQQLETTLQSEQASQHTITQLKERITQLKKEKRQLARLNWALKHEADRKKWLHETKKAKETQRHIEQLRQRITEQDLLMEQLATEGKFYPEAIAAPDQFEESLEEGFKLQTDKETYEAEKQLIEAQRQVYQEQREENQHNSALLRQQVAKLMNQRVNEEAQLEEATSFSHYVTGLVIAVVGVLATFIGSGLLRGLGVLLVIGGLAVTWWVYNHHKQLYEQHRQGDLLTEIHRVEEQQVYYNDNIQELSVEINERDDLIKELEESIRKSNILLKNWLTKIGFYPTADAKWVLQTNPVNQYFEAIDRQEQFQQDKATLLSQMDDWRTLLAPLFERFNPLEGTNPYLLRFVEETEATLATEVIRGQGIQEQINQAQQTIQTHETAIAEYDQLVEMIYQQSAVEDYAGFQQQLKTNTHIENLQQKRQLHQEQLVGYEDQLLDIQSGQELANRERQLKGKLEALQEELAPHHQILANLRLEIDNLQQDGTYEEQVQSLASLEDQIIAQMKEWGEKRLATELIYETLRQGMDNPLEKMNEIANRIFEQLSFGRYSEIRLNKSGVRVRQFSDLLFDPHELSQGTLEQLYIALRLAFIKSATGMVKMPILIDDAFVNFDEFRKSSMYQVLETISEDIQVLFFTFDQQAKESFRDEQMINLETIIGHDDVTTDLSKGETDDEATI